MFEIETHRLQLRRFMPQDLDNLYCLYRDPDVMKYVGKGVRTRQETQKGLFFMIDHYRYGFGLWAVVHKANGAFIGRCGLCYLDNTRQVELGYTFAKAYWNRGFATEASLASLRYGFEELKLDRIVAIAKPENHASRRVMEKVGMKYEKDAFYYNTDVVYYSISRKAYQSHQQTRQKL
ncbi:MAG TPA: GNAT family N-acetyltransferase [Cyanophyceae cyanobacterium]